MVMRIVPNENESGITELESMYAAEYGSKLPSFQMPPRGWTGPNPSYASGPVKAKYAPRSPGPNWPIGRATPPPNLPGPIWPGPGWHVGPGVVANPYGAYGLEEGSDSDFKKLFRFGVVDNGLLVLMTALGVGMDGWISNKLNISKGWGPIMGATLGNAVSDGVAGLTDGWKPALGVTLGCLVPVVPVFMVATLMKADPQEKKAQYILAGSSAALVLWAYLKK